mmetsp:Transcript_77347/g.128230  ORF Transcript_77347/g.128230 Transcript_77347/m.128230 type:complete len:105 (+) Transcript_77347:2-316(+)
MVRIHRAEQQKMAQPGPVVRPDTLAAALAGDPIAAYVAQYGVDQSAESTLRLLSPELQCAVMNDGPLRGTNTSAMLMSRIRRYQHGGGRPGSVPMAGQMAFQTR